MKFVVETEKWEVGKSSDIINKGFSENTMWGLLALGHNLYDIYIFFLSFLVQIIFGGVIFIVII